MKRRTLVLANKKNKMKGILKASKQAITNSLIKYYSDDNDEPDDEDDFDDHATYGTEFMVTCPC